MLLDEPTQGMGHEAWTASRSSSSGCRICTIPDGGAQHEWSPPSQTPSRCCSAAPCWPKGPTQKCPTTPKSWKPTWARPTANCRERTDGWRSCTGNQNPEAWYGESHVLHGVDVVVQPGEVVTLGRKWRRPHHHHARYHGLTGAMQGLGQDQRGVETVNMPTHRIAHLGVGYCPEERASSSLSCEENLPPPRARPGTPHDPAQEIYVMFPQPGRAQEQPGHAPRGEQQMLAVACILRTGANPLLLDEIWKAWRPSSGRPWPA